MTGDSATNPAPDRGGVSADQGDVHRALGLTDEERDSIVLLLGREPNHLELAMYAVMWSEHCSYKSSRLHLRRLPTEAPWVLVGPGENAGVVEVAPGLAAALRIESHNHPSAIEPYQGAATGAGGILRDVFTMGARPIALMDPLRFGPLNEPRSRWITEGVVRGISGYGNAVGVPTVGGEICFDPTFAANPLVNVFCLGLLPTKRLVLGRASGVGNLAVLLGASTGRDGIGGVSVLASAGFDAAAHDAKRPSVQVGDPYEEKRLLEACLAMLDAGLVVGIQDLGGAGLTCATSETASRGGVGMDVDVAAVPRREPGMEPFEVMTSESQERMLAIVTPADLHAVLDVCDRWEVRATVVGRVTAGGRLRVLDGFDGEVLADVPAATLHDDAPLYDRPRREPAGLAARWADEPPERATDGTDGADEAGAELMAMLADPAWVYRQYDHQLFLNTVVGPGHDATLLRMRDPATGVDTGGGLGLTADGNHRWCAVDPRRGTAMIVAEAVLNLACVGTRPLALVDCLNFGNPTHPEVMWQLSEAVDGMAEACRGLGVPVVGGNVSLYNESDGVDIDPAPVVAVLGVREELQVAPPGARLVEGHRVLLVGPEHDDPPLAGSLWAWNRGQRGGRVADPDLRAVAGVAAVVRDLVAAGVASGVHDVSEGGLALCLAEMVAHSGVGLVASGQFDRRAVFTETAGRVVVCVPPRGEAEVLARAAGEGVPVRPLGTAGGARLRVGDVVDLALGEVVEAFTGRLPAALGQPAASTSS